MKTEKGEYGSGERDRFLFDSSSLPIESRLSGTLVLILPSYLSVSLMRLFLVKVGRKIKQIEKEYWNLFGYQTEKKKREILFL